MPAATASAWESGSTEGSLPDPMAMRTTPMSDTPTTHRGNGVKNRRNARSSLGFVFVTWYAIRFSSRQASMAIRPHTPASTSTASKIRASSPRSISFAFAFVSRLSTDGSGTSRPCPS